MITNNFDPILLTEMDNVKLMNRTDTKYWLNSSHLPTLLNSVSKNYYLLSIDGESELPYATTYFDTLYNEMYISHHNGKLNRFKIRRRSYVKSGISFLEVKFKNNKGRTIKNRIPSQGDNIGITEEESKFLSKQTPYSKECLTPTLTNEFTRLTLVNKNFNERCTIDYNLHFRQTGAAVCFNDLAIVEIKSDGKPSGSPLALALRENRIKSSGFSKYCVGRTVVDTDLKQNAFKAKLRSIKKNIKTTYK